MGKDNKKSYKGKFKGSTWTKKRKSDDADWDNGGNDNRTDFDGNVSGGSYPLEEVKAMEEYQRRICHDNAPKRKYALAISYCGTNYQGLQINPGAVTVEGILERALFLAGGIQEANYGTLQKIAWTRAARTDRGVHAIGQCCSMKLTVPEGYENQFIADVNSFMPADIRAITLTRTTKSFNARSHCSHRRYQFLLPTYVFMPRDTMNGLLDDALAQQGEQIDAGRAGNFAPPNSAAYVGHEGLLHLRPRCLSYRISAHQLAVFRAAMSRYNGTHNYHNFTSAKVVTAAGSATMDSMQRYMMDITVSDPFLTYTAESAATGSAASCVDRGSSVTEEGEWVRVTLLGQSFLLNQIRKMIGLAVDITRMHKYASSCAGEGAVRSGEGEFVVDTSLMDMCLSPFHKVDVPVIPGLGLYLDELFFDKYNIKLDYEIKKMEAAVHNREVKRQRKEAEDKEGLETSSLLTSTSAVDVRAESVMESAATGGDCVEDTLSDKASASGVTMGLPDDSTSGRGGEQDVGLGNAEREAGSAMCVDKLQWGQDPAVIAAFERFRETVLWPHIYEQEKKSLDFLFYLDFLRVVPHSYNSGSNNPAMAADEVRTVDDKTKASGTSQGVRITMPTSRNEK